MEMHNRHLRPRPGGYFTAANNPASPPAHTNTVSVSQVSTTGTCGRAPAGTSRRPITRRVRPLTPTVSVSHNDSGWSWPGPAARAVLTAVDPRPPAFV
ncbi:Uncharacterized protein OBRU01_01990 [Operophtera brumata]|uniref:Uncharacterized protein n=1 Tax=Operophtera brumata TaxID=104452 RepID=A0A0L7LEI4_OPEBR|nr:Uncharacterized protein OBRU01_01990 [Operophtera brumata]